MERYHIHPYRAKSSPAIQVRGPEHLPGRIGRTLSHSRFREARSAEAIFDSTAPPWLQALVTVLAVLFNWGRSEDQVLLVLGAVQLRRPAQ